MRKVVDTYYVANDGKRFDNEEECTEYEKSISVEEELQSEIRKNQIEIRNNKIKLAKIRYKKSGRSIVKRVKDGGGNGHDGYYSKCTCCEALVGGYERRNLGIQIDRNVYICENCFELFSYS